MKNLIGYYYNLFIKDFKRSGDVFSFKLDNENYEFFPCVFDYHEVYRNYLIAKQVGRYCHEIIINKDGLIVTNYNGIQYMLIKKYICSDDIITFEEIINYDANLGSGYTLNWKHMWEEKIDYYENQFSQIPSGIGNLKYGFSYYVGLGETAISLLNYIKLNEIGFSICHRRVMNNETKCQFFNPIWLIIDNRTRDIAEFIKSNFMANSFHSDDIYFLLDYLQLNFSESILMLARLLYPTYFFDLYDQFILNKCNGKKINVILEQANNYEKLLKKVYLYFHNKYTFPNIEWLNN